MPNKQTCVVRVSINKAVQSVAKKLGRPITATSANKARGKNCYSIKEVLGQLKEKDFDLILDGGKLSKKKPSTIVRAEEGEVKILRQGEIKLKKL